MAKSKTLTVRPDSVLGEYVAANDGGRGTFERLRAELQHAFAAPDSAYSPLSAAVVIARALIR